MTQFRRVCLAAGWDSRDAWRCDAERWRLRAKNEKKNDKRMKKE